MEMMRDTRSIGLSSPRHPLPLQYLPPSLRASSSSRHPQPRSIDLWSSFILYNLLSPIDNTSIPHLIPTHKRTYKSSLLDIMGIVTSTLRSVNAWAHLPSTLRAGYVLGWGALFGANVSHRQSSGDRTFCWRARGLLLES